MFKPKQVLFSFGSLKRRADIIQRKIDTLFTPSYKCVVTSTTHLSVLPISPILLSADSSSLIATFSMPRIIYVLE
jgi:hypothetical protein